ncbi:MAG: hypothetical protein AB2792_16315 [Candidatus Thiodiazotropha sp.]
MSVKAILEMKGKNYYQDAKSSHQLSAQPAVYSPRALIGAFSDATGPIGFVLSSPNLQDRY